MRSQTDEQLAAKHDAEPLTLAFDTSVRLSVEEGIWNTRPQNYSPRVECIPSRDPYPYECEDSGLRMAEKGDTGFWSPRPEFARPPVNRILVAFRNGDWTAKEWLKIMGSAKGANSKIGRALMSAATVGFSRLAPHDGDWYVKNRIQEDAVWAMFDHAVLVLTRLAALA